MQLHFIVNELAGNGQGAKKWRIIRDKLTISYTVHITKYAGHVKLLVEQILAHLDEPLWIIVIGGDGTMNEVMNSVAGQKHVMISAVPAGSGNDFSRAFKSVESAQQIEDTVQYLTQRKYDLGVVKMSHHTRRFVNNSGIGFDAYVAISANESTLKKKLNKFGLGKLSYVYYVIVGLFRFRPFSLTVDDGMTKTIYHNVWFATVSNQPYFGGGMKLSPQSKMDDSRLELTVVHNLAKSKFLAVFGTVFLGQHTHFKEVHQSSGERYRLHIQSPQPMHTDGEKVLLPKGPQQLEFSIDAKSWQLAYRK